MIKLSAGYTQIELLAMLDVFKIEPKSLFDYEESLSLEDLKKNIINIMDKLDYKNIYKIHNYVSFLYTAR